MFPMKYIPTLVPSERLNGLQSNAMMRYFVGCLGLWCIHIGVLLCYDIILLCLTIGCSMYKLMLNESFRRHEIALQHDSHLILYTSINVRWIKFRVLNA